MVALPAGWAFESVANNNVGFNYIVRQGTRSTNSYTINPTVRNNAGNAELVFSLLAARQSGTIPFEGTEGVIYTINYRARPVSCNATTGSSTVTEYGRIRNPFSLTDSIYQLVEAGNLNYNAGNRATLVLSNTTGDVFASNVSNSWDLEITAKNNAASNIWLATEGQNGTVQIDSVGLLNASGVRTGALLTPNSYGATNKWYSVTPTLASNAKQKLRVYFRYSNCTKDSIKVFAGYDCNSDTTGPVGAVCSTNLSEVLYPKVTSRSSEIQISVSRQPGNGAPVNLCAPDSATFIVNSAGGAAIVNPHVQITLPIGMQLVSPIPVEFPIGSGQWQALTPTVISGTTVEVSLAQHNGIKDTGIRGSVDRTDNSLRQAKLKVAFTTDCTYRSGSNILASAFANRVCNGIADGNGTTIRTNPLNINGIPNSGGTINMDISIPTTTLSCGSSATLALTSTPLGSATQAGDTIIYTLPAGISYGGNFNAGANCSSCTVVTAPGAQPGTTEVEVRLTPGVAANTPIKYSFDITGARVISTGSCGASTILAQAVRTYPGVLSCNGSTYCSSSTQIIGSKNSGTITRTKPTLTPVQFIPLTATQPGTTVQYRLQYQNNGTQNAPAATYKAEILLSSAPNAPVYVATLQKAVAINASATDTITFVMPANAPNSALVSVRIAPDLKDGTKQCLCEEQTSTYATPLPVNLLSFEARLVNQNAVALNWSVAQLEDVASFQVERSTNSSEFAAIDKLTAEEGKLNYQTMDTHLPEATRIYYRLKMFEKSGAHQYSSVQTIFRNKAVASELTIIPNPAQAQVTLRWESLQTGIANIHLFNSQGASVLHKQMQIQKAGTQEITLSETASLASGVYLIRITTTNGEELSGRLQILR